MSINSFTYNGVSSESLGLYVGGQQTFGSPQRDVTKVSIPGRNGDLIRDNGRFLNAQIAYNAVAMSDFKNKAQSVRNWLMSAKGYKRLEDTYHPEHYRMARVADSVDFETGAFNATGKAKIIFDCMPQRFLKSGETVISGDPVERSASGEIASFETDYVVPMTSAEVSLSPQQDLNGYDSPWPGGGGKNKLPSLLSSQTTTSGLTLTPNTDGSITISGTATNTSAVLLSRISYAEGDFPLPAGTYTLSRGSYAADTYIYIQAVPWIGSALFSRNAKGTVTYANDISIRYTDIGINAASGETINVTIYPQLESGSTATAYAPYSNICPISGHTGAELKIGATYPTAVNTYSVTFTDQGTVYGGTYDWVTGELVIDHVLYTDSGSAGWIRNTSGSFYLLASFASSAEQTADGCYCNYAPYAVSFTGMSVFVRPTNSTISLGNGWGEIYATADELKAAFAQNPLQIVYKLATPLEFTLSAQQIETLLGENNVWSDAGEISLTFYEPAELDNPTLFDSKPLIRAYGSGDGQVTIGNQIITLTDIDGYIDIDCETMDCYNGVENCNSKVTLGAQGFPTLPPGITAVSFGGGVTRVEITPRWWEL